MAVVTAAAAEQQKQNYNQQKHFKILQDKFRCEPCSAAYFLNSYEFAA